MYRQTKMDLGESHCTRLLVAAFDVGTTFSGYAFSFTSTPRDIKCNQEWNSGTGELISLKTSTCVLLNPDKKFDSFGYEAENKYSELAEDDEHQRWYMFRRFKMTLYDTKDLHLDTQIEDISGKKMSALTIFSHCITYLNTHLLEELAKEGVEFTQEDIQYVITVPAIWDQRAKQFMRKAAEQSGIKADQLIIALEPEAASIYCQGASDHALSKLSNSGFKYMVVDLGGGTADITVHENLANGTLKEVYKANGGSWGGVKVDKAFLQMLTNVVGDRAMEQFKTENIGDFFDLVRGFEVKKRTITTHKEKKVTFRIPVALTDIVKSKGYCTNKLVQRSPYDGKMSWSGDKLRIQNDLAQSLFDEVINKITDHLKDLLTKPHINDINALLLVGGFANCELVRVAIEKSVSCGIIVPLQPQLAVVKGAVRFGHLTQIVSSRVARYTYGKEVSELYDDKRHDWRKQEIFQGTCYCVNVFSKMVTIEEDIPVGREVCQVAHAVTLDQKTMLVRIFSSEKKNPMYVTEKDCSLLGEIEVELPDADKIEDKYVKTYLKFGDTELKVRVVTPTGKTYNKEIKCL